MKIVIFNGTPRKNGNTAALTESIKSNLGDDTVEEIFLSNLNFKGCVNCGACQKKIMDTKCAQKDDMIELYDKVLNSDLIILASPIYMWNFTAPLVAFISRLHSLRAESLNVNKMARKKIAVAVTMGDDEFVAGSAVNALLDFCEYYGAKYVGAIAIPFANKEQINRALYQEKIKDFVESIKS